MLNASEGNGTQCIANLGPISPTMLQQSFCGEEAQS